MIKDIISMSASTLDDNNRRVFCVTFDRRISAECALDFITRSAIELIESPEPKMVMEATFGGKEVPQPTTPPRPNSEREKACKIANNILDNTAIDPDSDFSILSRQYLRALEKIDRLSIILDAVLAQSDERHSPIRGFTIEELKREAADKWPSRLEASQ